MGLHNEVDILCSSCPFDFCTYLWWSRWSSSPAFTLSLIIISTGYVTLLAPKINICPDKQSLLISGGNSMYLFEVGTQSSVLFHCITTFTFWCHFINQVNQECMNSNYQEVFKCRSVRWGPIFFFFLWDKVRELSRQNDKNWRHSLPNQVLIYNYDDIICLTISKKVAGCVWVPSVLFFAHLKLAKLSQKLGFTHIKKLFTDRNVWLQCYVENRNNWMPLCTEKQARASKYFNPLMLYRAAYMFSAGSLVPARG